MKINQRDIVEISFELPDGQLKIHPAVVISSELFANAEDSFYAVMISSKPYNEEFSIELKSEMVTKPLYKTSYVKCHLIASYHENEVFKKLGMVTKSAFEQIKLKVIESIFS